jgi:hypothetical protein
VNLPLEEQRENLQGLQASTFSIHCNTHGLGHLSDIQCVPWSLAMWTGFRRLNSLSVAMAVAAEVADRH